MDAEVLLKSLTSDAGAEAMLEKPDKPAKPAAEESGSTKPETEDEGEQSTDDSEAQGESEETTSEATGEEGESGGEGTEEAEGGEQSGEEAEPEAGEGETGQSLLAGKYRNVKELEKGYHHADRLIAQLQAETKALRDAFTALAATKGTAADSGVAIQPLLGEEDEEPVFDKDTKAFLDSRLDPETQQAVTLIVKAATAKIKAERKEADKASQVVQIKTEFPNYLELMGDVQKLIDGNPRVYSKFPAVDLFRIVRGMKPPKPSAVKPKASAESQAERERKVKAGFVDGGAGSGGSRPRPTLAGKKKPTREDSIVSQVFGQPGKTPRLV